METLYTSCEADGSIAEIYSLLAAQPVFPSKIRWLTYEVEIELNDILSVPSLQQLAELGVEVSRYSLREYERTQEIADAALFLGFQGLVVPSARWDCTNLVIFMEKIAPSQMTIVGSPKLVNWTDWRERRTAIREKTDPGD